ncbi:hypothetical protein ABZS77_15650 [Micromonospora sp. NPDC005298]|uniref:hypothetical protein n=1 Tax=Micromonospora sp. NPDC005298 TaxID=3156873 RepID=UPI0033BEAE32
MKPSRVASALLILAATTVLTACGGEDAAPTAGSTPPAPTSAAPASAAPSTPATPTSAAAAPSGATTGGTSDKKLCESAKKAGDEMKAALIEMVRTGEPSAADYKKILTGIDRELTRVASTGAANSKVAAALRRFGDEAAKAAAAPDPASAADNPTFEKAGATITSACKAAGVSVNF